MHEFRTQLLASTTILALSGIAYAADMPVKAPPMAPAPPAISWTGWYVGLNGGYHWGADPCVQTLTTNVSSIGGLNGDIGAAVASQGTGRVCTDDSGFIGGGQVGYNWQINKWVVGLETDFQGATNGNNQASITNVGTVPGSGVSSTGRITSSTDLRWLGTLRGRLGIVVDQSLLVYGTGGLAYGKVDGSTTITETLGYSDTPAPFGTGGSFSGTRTGWTAGGGFEYMFAPNWSVKAEYLYYDLGQVTGSLGNINQFGDFGTLLETVSASQSTTRLTGNIARFGVNYIFH